jgi:hypothetical protein
MLALFMASAAVADAQQTAKDPNEEWKLVNSYGFPVWIASNFVIDAPALSHRHIYQCGKLQRDLSLASSPADTECSLEQIDDRE